MIRKGKSVMEILFCVMIISIVIDLLGHSSL